MMSQVRNFSKIILCTLLLLAAGCKDKCDPFVDPGKVEDPHWELAETDMPSSMTATVNVSFADQPGTLAAFIGDDCCGIAGYTAENGLYWLMISPVTEGGEVQLRFYSPELKRIFVATETFPFQNNAQLGSVAEPYTPNWKVSK